MRDPALEATLEETVHNALQQIEEKGYDAMLSARGILQERIRHYGFAFEEKKVLIGGWGGISDRAFACILEEFLERF